MISEQINLKHIEKRKRTFLPNDLALGDWETLKPYFEMLLERELNSVKDLIQFLHDQGELEAFLEEDMGWRYINMARDTTSEEKKEAYFFFVNEIQPHLSKISHQLNEKIVATPFFDQLPDDPYLTLKRSVNAQIELFREENIPLQTQEDTLKQEYGAITGNMTIHHEGEEITLQKAATFLKDPNRATREEVYRKVGDRRLEDAEKLDDLFDKLLELRHKIAKNAGFDNYRDYMFKALGRFDYQPSDCLEFHKAIEKEVMPFTNTLANERKEQLGVDMLRPWDMSVDPKSRPALKPFSDEDDLFNKTHQCLTKVSPFFGECLQTLARLDHLDLGTRKGKAPGGFNYPLDEIGVPFIFMNAAGTVRDVVTLIHEGGHAVHSLVTRNQTLSYFMHTPSEAAELASMSMELLTLPNWSIFFDDEKERDRAISEHLEDVFSTLPWVATIDAFQHWLYTNPGHSREERKSAWKEQLIRFYPKAVDFSDLEEYMLYLWQKQLHLYEVPFYYIEYGIAQLGAIAIWKRYQEEGTIAIEDYLKALSLGYTKPLGGIYETAGIKFDFTGPYIKELISFLSKKHRTYTNS